MRRIAAVVVLATLLTLPFPASAQLPLGVGVRVGTLGIGADAALGLSDHVQVRGGVGIQPWNPEGSFSDIDFRLDLPGTFATLGVDLFPGGGGFRIGGGVLFKPDDPTLEGVFTGSVEIGDRTYTGAEVGTLTGEVASASVAPFVMIGLGKHAAPGVKLFLDLGAAFLGDPDLTLRADGPISGDAEFQANLERERQAVQEDLDRWVKVYPILNLGLRVGIGG